MSFYDSDEYGLVRHQSSALQGIVRLAATGEISLGERFSETELAAGHLGLSRTPIRQALAILAFCGVAEIEPQVGTRLILPTTDELRQLTEMNQLGEKQAVTGKGASNALFTDEEIGGAFRSVENSLEGETTDVDAFLRADTNFHRTICLLAGNVATAHIMNMWGLKRRIYRIAQPELATEQLQALVAADRRIFTTVIGDSAPGNRRHAVRAYYNMVRQTELSES